MSTGVLVWAEVLDGRITEGVFELLALAQQLRSDLRGEVGVVIGDAPEDLTVAALIAHGADSAYVFDDGAGDHPTDAAVAALKAAALVTQPRLILVPHSSRGAEIAPRIAFACGSAAAMGCVDVRVEADSLWFTRPCYGGKAHAVVRVETAPAVATLRPKAVSPRAIDSTRRGKIARLRLPPDVRRRVRLLSRRPHVQSGVRLDEAKIVVGGGRGLGGPEGFGLLEQLADVLGGAVGASRPACDLGWYSQSRQIGLTGTTIAPELYVAVGISGAQHHMAGCGNAKVLVAINNDPDAAIFSFAHFGILGDYREIVPALIAALERAR